MPTIEVLDEPITVIGSSPAQSDNQQSQTCPTTDDIITILKSSPSPDTLISLLDSSPVRLYTPNPDSTRILPVLLSHTFPSFWPTCRQVRLDQTEGSTAINSESRQLYNFFLTTFKSITGIRALLASIQAQSSRLKTKFTGSSAVSEKNAVSSLSSQLVELVELVLEGDNVCHDLYSLIQRSSDSPEGGLDDGQARILKQELIKLVTSNKISTVIGESEQLSGNFRSWVVGGQEFSFWVARNISTFITTITIEEHDNHQSDQPTTGGVQADISQMILRGLRLGYAEPFTHELVCAVLSRPDPDTHFKQLIDVVGQMSTLNQSRVLLCFVRSMSKSFPLSLSDDPKLLKSTSNTLGTVFTKMIEGMDHANQILAEFLTQPSGFGIANSIPVLRALLFALSISNESIQTILESSLASFGDPLHINNSPALLQEFTAQKIMIAAGYIHRTQPMALFTLARSSYFSDGVSNRLSSSSERARLLGMIVGTALSKLIDKDGSQLKFEDEEFESDWAKLYFNLVAIDDGPVGTIEDAKTVILETRVSSHPSSFRGKKNSANLGDEELDPASPTNSSVRIVDLDDESTKPVVKQKEPKPYDPLDTNNAPINPPVYIRDLLSGLRNTDDLDRHSVALSSSADLIRRQAAQPTIAAELGDVFETLAESLAGLHDHAEIGSRFETQRQDALVALIVSQPEKAAPYLIRLLFDGDYSISQRLAIISSIGLASVELAGIKELLQPTNHDNEKKATDSGPQRETRRFTAATLALEASIVHPIAAQVADQFSGPDSFKVETAASVSKTRYKSSAMARRRQNGLPSSASDDNKKVGQQPNLLAKIVAEHFFFPLTSRFWASYQAYGRSSPFVTGFILPLFLKTLALLLDAAGPSSREFPQMISELWSLLLAMRTVSLAPSFSSEFGVEAAAASDSANLSALLFSLLVLLDGVEQSSPNKAEIFDLVPGLEGWLVETLNWTRGLLEQADRAESEVQVSKVGFGVTGMKITGDDPLIQIRLGDDQNEKEKKAGIAGTTGPSVPGGMEGERVQILSASVWTKCRDLVVARKEGLMGRHMDLFQ